MCFPTFPTTVHTLVFRILRGQVTGIEVKLLFGYLLDLKARNPGLKTVQLCSETNIRAIQKHWFRLQSRLLEIRLSGLSILDNTGNIMLPEFG